MTLEQLAKRLEYLSRDADGRAESAWTFDQKAMRPNYAGRAHAYLDAAGIVRKMIAESGLNGARVFKFNPIPLPENAVAIPVTHDAQKCFVVDFEDAGADAAITEFERLLGRDFKEIIHDIARRGIALIVTREHSRIDGEPTKCVYGMYPSAGLMRAIAALKAGDCDPAGAAALILEPTARNMPAGC